MMRLYPPAGIVVEFEDSVEPFCLGAFTIGVLFGYSDESYGWGLFLSIDPRAPDPGFMLVVGPLALDFRLHEYIELRLLRRHLWGMPLYR